MSQRKWKLIANLGDVNPIDYGGYFIFEDETGVYPPEGELLISPDSDERGEKYIVYRFMLEPCTYDESQDILSDNKFHPDFPAWFAKPESERKERPQDTTYLEDVCRCMDVPKAELIRMFLSENPIERADAYRCVGEYHGFENFDNYPLRLSRKEVEERYGNHPYTQEKIASV